MPALSTARTAALSYALLVLLAGLLLLTGTLSQPDVSWHRIAGHTGIALIAPLPPFATLWLGGKLANTETAGRALTYGVILSVLVPAVLGLLIALSSEPLAILLLFYTPAIQLVIGLATLAVVWAAGCNRGG